MGLILPNEGILKTWRKFDRFPMETISKLWVYNQAKVGRQREISLMKEHRERYGLSGNCFDLAIWLLHEFKNDHIEAYPIGHHIDSTDAHVAVVALDENGNRYLCDLGDQWIIPVLIDDKSEDFTDQKLNGFFPSADIQVNPNGTNVDIYYHRPNGKVSKQTYDTTPIDKDHFLKAAELSQNTIRPIPLIESRISYKNEVAHWEFDDWEISLSTSEGLMREETKVSTAELAVIISDKVGFDQNLLHQILEQYSQWKNF